jgi:transposase
MKRFVEGEDRRQGVLLPEYLDDFVSEENPVRVIDAFVEELDLRALGFAGVVPEATGRPGYHPAAQLKIYVYGYINQIASSRRLERETQRNVEMMWLTGRLTPDFKTIADFRKDNGPATLHTYWTTKCGDCALKAQCTTGKQRRIKRWEHEAVIDAMQQRLDRAPKAMRIRRATVEHPFGTIKAWMGATHFRMKTLERVRTEMSLHVLAYNLKRVIAILGPAPLMQAMRA